MKHKYKVGQNIFYRDRGDWVNAKVTSCYIGKNLDLPLYAVFLGSGVYTGVTELLMRPIEEGNDIMKGFINKEKK